MSRENIVNYYLEKSKHKDFQINQIRKELEPKRIPDEEIRNIVKIVDNAVQRRELNQSHNTKANEITIAGGILTLLGAGITIGTYTGFIDMGNSFLIVYGPFFGGLSLLITGLARR